MEVEEGPEARDVVSLWKRREGEERVVLWGRRLEHVTVTPDSSP